jgi:hypothetical protein
MTDPKGAAGQSPLKRLSLPDWTPETVRGTIREIEQTKLTPELRMTLGRMALDPRMQTVWGELLKRDRPSGQFKYPALLPESPYLTSIDAVQFAALGETFRFVFSAARKKVPVSKPNEGEQSKESLIQHAQSLRRVANDLRLALSKGQLGIASREMKEQAGKDLPVLLRVASWLERLAFAHRRPDSLLMVKNDRDDPRCARGTNLNCREFR